MIDFFERYADQMIPEPNSGCLLWIGAVTSVYGYGHGNRDGEHFYAHRAAFESVNGVGSADGLVVRHWCDQPPCCNPNHLLSGTQIDNAMDSVSRGRANRAYGENVPTAKLDDDIVIKIRRLFSGGMKIATIRTELALEHVKWDTVDNAARGITWKHLENR